MRRSARFSEARKLGAPIARSLERVWERMHWWVIAMAALYAVSGITVIRPDEVAVVLRWGRLIGASPALREHGPGLLFAFPKPIDEVVRVKVKRVFEVAVKTLAQGGGEGFHSLNPLSGYALTGDRNIVHVEMVARYRVKDPAAFSLYGAQAEDILRVEVTAAMVRSLGEMGVDRVLSDGRKDLIAAAVGRTQAALDAVESGMELTSIELIRLAPPEDLAPDFNAVQSAFIGAETRRKDALAYAQAAVPQAQASVEATVQGARAAAAADLSLASGEAQAFRDLAREYRSNPTVFRERLYRDGIDRAVANAGSIRWVPPPVGGRYQGLRISISSFSSTTAAFPPEAAIQGEARE